MPKIKTPLLVPLRFGEVYCGLCRETITAGQRVAWWKVIDNHGRDVPKSRRYRSRKAAYCATCHRANVAAGLRGEHVPIRGERTWPDRRRTD